MPKLQQYTSKATTGQLNQRQATGADFGTEKAEASIELSEASNGIEEKRRNRIDTINRVRMTEQFYNDAFNEFNRTQSEDDLINPATTENFNYKLRQKANEVITQYQGSPESKADFEASILNHMGSFTRQMTQNSIAAQRGFIMKNAGGQINDLAKQARDNPAMLGEIYKKADAMLNEFAPALYPEDELDLTDAAHEAITLNALQSYTDSGQYEDAKQLINDNPFFLQKLSPDSQKRILSEIQTGIADKEKTIRETKSKITAIKSAAQELGMDVDGPTVFAAVTGIENAKTVDQKIEEFARVTKQDASRLSPSVIAKIGFGVDLPGGDIDYNKDYMPDGGLTPQGIGKQIKVPFETASAAKMYQEKIVGAIELFRQNGNKQALLSAMITFQKALDEGAVVREGDIVLQREAQGLGDKISLWTSPGQVVGDDLVDEMEVTMNDFTRTVLEHSKSKIDPFIQDAQERGFRPLDYGVPQEAYQKVFGAVKGSDKKPGMSKSTMTADEFLQQ